MDKTIGRFTIQSELGRGGMGVVFIGYDDTLERQLAIKVMRETGNPEAAARMLREARLAARVNHPNVCQIFEVGEDAGQIYIAMELLEGENLAQRLKRGYLPLPEALQASLAVLAALEELHRKGLVHRDIKPSNVFLTRHGVKLLDFGLARPHVLGDDETQQEITRAGALVGTPRYMSPEQWLDASLGPASDLFSFGLVLYEMVTGNPALPGASASEIREAVLNRQPPALAGDAAVIALDRVIQRALEKKPEDRYPGAAAMSAELRQVLLEASADHPLRVQRATRLIALPFRVLRPDPETDFLSQSLPDAITGSLSGLDSVVVRSPLSLPAAAGAELDLRGIARQTDVDLILAGTLLRAQDRIRVTAQLLDAGTGTVAWADTLQGSLGDLFELQDTMAQQIVESLALPLTGMERKRMGRDVPATAHAYELYLRANEGTFATAYLTPLEKARDLYQACLAEDPAYAPAWARLGRIYRILGKYGTSGHAENDRLAREAFDRALTLNPDLSLAHNYLTYLEMDEGRGADAMGRLIARGHSRATDPQLFAGLVGACRFCGLLEASVAAHRRAMRLDPGIRTGVHYTHWMRGEYERAAALDNDVPAFCRLFAPSMLGRTQESIAAVRDLLEGGIEGIERISLLGALAGLEGRKEEALAKMHEVGNSGFRDPEGLYIMARILPVFDEHELALRWLDRIVGDGFYCHSTMERDPGLDPLRENPEFIRILKLAEQKRRECVAIYDDAGGPRLLGVREE